jgi:hypothetical protein
MREFIEEFSSATGSGKCTRTVVPAPTRDSTL